MGNVKRPRSILDKREELLLETLQKKYEDAIKPKKIQSFINTTQKKLGDTIPDSIKQKYGEAILGLSEFEIYKKLLGVVAEGYKQILTLASKLTLSQKQILKEINSVDPEIKAFEEITFARSYKIQKLFSKQDNISKATAMVEGGVTGFFGLPGLLFNIASSNFFYFRAIQNVAMYYGYDVQHDPIELEVCGDVLTQILSNDFEDKLGSGTSTIGRIMMYSELDALKEMIKKKTFVEMARSGGVGLLYAQIRASGYKQIQTQLEKAGIQEIEKNIFTMKLLPLVGKNISKDVMKKGIPILGALLGAGFDTAVMSKILKFANMFYHRRFLMEKPLRISLYLDQQNDDNIED